MTRESSPKAFDLCSISPQGIAEARGIVGCVTKGETDPNLDNDSMFNSVFGKMLRATFRSESHFLKVLPEATRNHLVDRVRRRKALRRGGAVRHEALVDHPAHCPEPLAIDETDRTRLDAALRWMRAHHPREAEAYLLRLKGCTNGGIAKLLGGTRENAAVLCYRAERYLEAWGRENG